MEVYVGAREGDGECLGQQLVAAGDLARMQRLMHSKQPATSGA